MKVLNEAGDVIHECSDDDGLLVFTKEGIHAVLPKENDENQEAPAHVMMAAATMVYLTEADGRAEVREHFEQKLRRSH